MPWILACPWLLQYSSLALYPSHNPAVGSIAIVEPIEEDKKEEEDDVADMEEGSSTENLSPKQVPEPWATMPAVPEFWAVNPSDQVARRGPGGN